MLWALPTYGKQIILLVDEYSLDMIICKLKMFKTIQKNLISSEVHLPTRKFCVTTPDETWDAMNNNIALNFDLSVMFKSNCLSIVLHHVKVARMLLSAHKVENTGALILPRVTRHNPNFCCLTQMILTSKGDNTIHQTAGVTR